MKYILFGVFALFLPQGAFAVDADGFFYAKPASGGFGEARTSEENGVLQAVYTEVPSQKPLIFNVTF